MSENKINKTYKELSAELRELYPKVIAAYQLVPQMYNYLTIVDRMSHKNVLKKIFTDHKDLEGFSRTNVYRALPKENPNIPHRVVPLRDKSIATKLNSGPELSSTKISPSSAEVKPTINEITSANTQCSDCLVKLGKIEELEEKLKACSRSVTGGNSVLVKDIQRELEISIPFHDLRMHMIRQHNLSGKSEPVLIYATTVSTCSKAVSYSLGKKPYS